MLCDVGGKAERVDATAWATAVRECREECGIDLSGHFLSPHDEVLPLKKRDGETFGVVFVVACSARRAPRRRRAFARVLQRYRETSGHEPDVVEGSSAGALQFCQAVVRLKPL